MVLCGPIVIRDARLGRWESHVTSMFQRGIYSCRLVMSKKSYTDVKKDQSVATVILIEGLCRKSSSRLSMIGPLRDIASSVKTRIVSVDAKL